MKLSQLITRQRVSSLTLLACAAIIQAACGSRDATSADVRVDTLPGNILRTTTAHPVDSGHWSLTLEHVIQPPAGDTAELLEPGDIAFADDGSIAIAESRPPHVKIFSPDGKFVRSIGRAGDGPGEFRVAFIGFIGDSLVVHDPRASRLSVFNWRSGEFVTSRASPCCYFHPIAIDHKRRVWIRSVMRVSGESRNFAQTFARLSMTDERTDTLVASDPHVADEGKSWQVKEGNLVQMVVGVPYQPRAWFAVEPSGSVLTGWSGDYSLRSSSDGSDTLSIFGRPFAPVAVAQDEKQTLVDAHVQRIKAMEPDLKEADLRTSFDISFIPDVRPAFEHILVDAAGRRWVRQSQDDVSKIVFDLFDADGRWLDVLVIPGSDWGETAALGVDRVAVALEGADGRPVVRVYRFARRG